MKTFRSWLEAIQYGAYKYVHSCVSSTYEDIWDMVDNSVEITRRTFLQYVDREDLKELERELGYDRWFHIANDWHVTYHKGTYRDTPCVYLQHSGIEHIFTLNGECGASKGGVVHDN